MTNSSPFTMSYGVLQSSPLTLINDPPIDDDDDDDDDDEDDDDGDDDDEDDDDDDDKDDDVLHFLSSFKINFSAT